MTFGAKHNRKQKKGNIWRGKNTFFQNKKIHKRKKYISKGKAQAKDTSK